ncbi:hypothetical protein [Nocardia rhizosphaerae]|uniref:N-acetyltransferase domain-containing protein n=1 Tax=Nocardia rhizosphaerae TaxID=1691571 RepID=A0ABV8LAN9_9NOCA
MTVQAQAPALSASICITPCELDQARAFRSNVFRSRRNIGFDAGLERRRDADAIMVIVVRHAGRLVATLRTTAFPCVRSTITPRPELDELGVDSEVGRLAAVADPSRARFALTAMVLGAMWMRDFSSHRTYVAHAHPYLIDSYRAVGAFDTGLRQQVAGRDTDYRLVVGSYADCARMGMELLGLAEYQAGDLLKR